MNLKKSDKIIAIAAVLVLIVAAIGIIFYTETDGEDEVPKNGEEEYTTYDVVYDIVEVKLDKTNHQLKDKLFGKDINYNEVFEISNRHVKQIDFNITFKDNHKGRLLKNLGADELKVTICGTNMAEQKKTIKGEGKVTLSSDSKSALNLESIEAKDEFDARDRLDENLSLDTMMENYTITASIKHGEKLIFTPFRWLLEKLGKDSFSIEITYTYYDYSLEEPEESDISPIEPKTESTGGVTYSNTFTAMGKL